MLKNQTIEKLRDMKLKSMAQMLSEPAPSYLELSFEESLGLMVEKEWMAKKNSKIKRLLRNATLGLNIITTGKTGSGKTYLICAFGNNACRKGYTAKYYRIPELLIEIQEAKAHGQYSRFMRGLQATRLLLLDDIGLKSYTLEESRDILEIAESRYNRGSMILAGQISHSQWYELFPDPTIADAIMDRIIHNSYILELDSKLSMREVMASRKMQHL
ncbi:MAG TPA: ATP-binding protein [Negativicutes bacterium]|nr:ATP-binding protein [Negativicutes bacterium]